jgi:hypothetical protein
MKVGSLPDGSRGIDVNSPITVATAALFVAKGYTFVVRYVRRSQAHTYDLTQKERDIILGNGMGLMVVQHVAPPGWVPAPDIGSLYGAVAAAEARKAGILAKTHCWLDLEGVKPGVPAEQVVQFCNRWHDEVWGAGYQPGLYVGDAPGLSAVDLYKRLKFRSYWGAYNLNADNVPVTRGLQMRQKVAHPSDWVEGFNSQNMDCDVIHVDALGGTPSVLLP